MPNDNRARLCICGHGEHRHFAIDAMHACMERVLRPDVGDTTFCPCNRFRPLSALPPGKE